MLFRSYMELHRVPNYSLMIHRNKKTLPNTQSTYNVLKGRSYNKEYFDRFSFLDIYHFGGIHVLHEYISVNDHDYSFRVLRDFYLNYNLCEFDNIVPESLRYSNGTIRSRYDIDTLFQIIIQFIHYGDMYLSRKKNIYFGGANIFLISLIGILIMSTISIFSSIIVNIIKNK